MGQIVDKTIMEADKDRDGKISFEEFTKMVENTDVSMSMTLGKLEFQYHSPTDLALQCHFDSDGVYPDSKLLTSDPDQF